MHPLERALGRTLRWLVPALVMSLPLLAVPRPGDPFWLFLIQLAVISAFGVVLAVDLTRCLAASGWWTETDWATGHRRLATASTLIALVTGAVALLTLASSAALRLEPSLQFLQLLSALDIACVVAAVVFGVYLRWGTRARAWIGGSLIGGLCVMSIWRYLDVVGFTPSGGWKVAGADLMRYVIPFDVMAAVVALVVLWIGSQAGLRTEQARLQS